MHNNRRPVLPIGRTSEPVGSAPYLGEAHGPFAFLDAIDAATWRVMAMACALAAVVALVLNGGVGTAYADDHCDPRQAACQGFWYTDSTGDTWTAEGLRRVSDDLTANGTASRYYKRFHDAIVDPSGWSTKAYGMMCVNGSDNGSDTCSYALGTDAIRFHLVGIDQDARADGKGLAGLTFMTTDGRAIPTHSMNADDSSVGGWRDSALRKDLNAADGNIWSKTPQAFRDNVLAVSKKSHNGAGEGYGSAQATVDKMWLPEAGELWNDGTGTGANGVGLRQYEFFSAHGVGSWGLAQALLDSTSVPAADSFRWLRGANYASGFRVIISDGSYSVNDASNRFGVVPGFSL